MIRFIGRKVFPKLGPDQAEREVRIYLAAIAIGAVFAVVIATLAVQRYHQL